MASYYRLNLNQQSNGDHEVHKQGCSFYPTQNYDSLGSFEYCFQAVAEAKRKYPFKKINGCYFCANACHTS